MCKKPLISSELESEKESSILAVEVKGNDERVRKVSQDEIPKKEKREIDRNAGTNLDAKTLQFAWELTKEMIKDSCGVEGHELSPIPEDEEDSELDANFVDLAQRDLDNISREPHEFTYPVPAYQVLASQSNQ